MLKTKKHFFQSKRDSSHDSVETVLCNDLKKSIEKLHIPDFILIENRIDRIENPMMRSRESMKLWSLSH